MGEPFRKNLLLEIEPCTGEDCMSDDEKMAFYREIVFGVQFNF